VEACFRLLGDTGLGGGRSQGWGHFDIEETRRGPVRDLVLGHRPHQSDAEPAEPAGTVHWLLSLFVPSAADAIDWTRGSYSLVDRGGRVESSAGWGAAKKNLRMVREGSVLASTAAPRGAAVDVAPDGFPHPVYRSGLAVSLELPWRGNA
jgi:CRISPR type III-A-associated RAMP protein Csm4